MCEARTILAARFFVKQNRRLVCLMFDFYRDILFSGRRFICLQLMANIAVGKALPIDIHFAPEGDHFE